MSVPHHQLAIQIKAKLPRADVHMPEKTLFHKTSADFINKRKNGLSAWLAAVLQPEVMDRPDTREVRCKINLLYASDVDGLQLVVKFLSAKAYARQKLNVAKRIMRDVSTKVARCCSNSM